jgi:hypothetical protein
MFASLLSPFYRLPKMVIVKNPNILIGSGASKHAYDTAIYDSTALDLTKYNQENMRLLQRFYLDLHNNIITNNNGSLNLYQLERSVRKSKSYITDEQVYFETPPLTDTYFHDTKPKIIVMIPVIRNAYLTEVYDEIREQHILAVTGFMPKIYKICIRTVSLTKISNTEKQVKSYNDYYCTCNELLYFSSIENYLKSVNPGNQPYVFTVYLLEQKCDDFKIKDMKITDVPGYFAAFQIFLQNLVDRNLFLLDIKPDNTCPQVVNGQLSSIIALDIDNSHVYPVDFYKEPTEKLDAAVKRCKIFMFLLFMNHLIHNKHHYFKSFSIAGRNTFPVMDEFYMHMSLFLKGEGITDVQQLKDLAVYIMQKSCREDPSDSSKMVAVLKSRNPINIFYYYFIDTTVKRDLQICNRDHNRMMLDAFNQYLDTKMKLVCDVAKRMYDHDNNMYISDSESDTSMASLQYSNVSNVSKRRKKGSR